MYRYFYILFFIFKRAAGHLALGEQLPVYLITYSFESEYMDGGFMIAPVPLSWLRCEQYLPLYIRGKGHYRVC